MICLLFISITSTVCVSMIVSGQRWMENDMFVIGPASSMLPSYSLATTSGTGQMR